MEKTLMKDLADFTANFPFVEELKGKTIVVTGATGLLGSVTVKCLLALNEKYDLGLSVVAIVRNIGKALEVLGPETKTLTLQMFDFASECQFDTCNADYLIHYASPTSSKYFVERPVETMNISYEGTKSVLEYTRFNKLSSMVYASSLEVYGIVTDDEKPLTEDMQGYINPSDIRSSYPMAKRAAECLCSSYASEYGVPVKIARFAQTFGAGVAPEDTRVFAHFARSIIKGENIELNTKGELCRCYCYTMDAVMGVFYVLFKGKDGEAYNVANASTYISVADMAKKLCEDFIPNLKVVFNLKEGMGFSPVTHLRMSAEKVEALGWKPQYNLKKMFERLIESMKD